MKILKLLALVTLPASVLTSVACTNTSTSTLYNISTLPTSAKPILDLGILSRPNHSNFEKDKLTILLNQDVEEIPWDSLNLTVVFRNTGGDLNEFDINPETANLEIDWSKATSEKVPVNGNLIIDVTIKFTFLLYFKKDTLISSSFDSASLPYFIDSLDDTVENEVQGFAYTRMTNYERTIQQLISNVNEYPRIKFDHVKIRNEYKSGRIEIVKADLNNVTNLQKVINFNDANFNANNHFDIEMKTSATASTIEKTNLKIVQNADVIKLELSDPDNEVQNTKDMMDVLKLITKDNPKNIFLPSARYDLTLARWTEIPNSQGIRNEAQTNGLVILPNMEGSTIMGDPLSRPIFHYSTKDASSAQQAAINVLAKNFTIANITAYGNSWNNGNIPLPLVDRPTKNKVINVMADNFRLTNSIVDMDSQFVVPGSFPLSTKEKNKSVIYINNMHDANEIAKFYPKYLLKDENGLQIMNGTYAVDGPGVAYPSTTSVTKFKIHNNEIRNGGLTVVNGAMIESKIDSNGNQPGVIDANKFFNSFVDLRGIDSSRSWVKKSIGKYELFYIKDNIFTFDANYEGTDFDLTSNTMYLKGDKRPTAVFDNNPYVLRIREDSINPTSNNQFSNSLPLNILSYQINQFMQFNTLLGYEVVKSSPQDNYENFIIGRLSSPNVPQIYYLNWLTITVKPLTLAI